MENIIDWDEFEAELANNKKAGTHKMWMSIWAIVGILSITFFGFTLKFDSLDFTGEFGTGWTFDYNTFLQLLLGSISTTVVTGLKIQAGLSKVIARQRILAEKDKIIQELTDKIQSKNTEIAVLKRDLDDSCTTHSANSAALDKVKGADVKKEANNPCPTPKVVLEPPK